MNPYIGIVDFTTRKQVEEMLAVFYRHRGRNAEKVLHVGVMMSYKTLHGIPTKWDKAFPPKETINDIFGWASNAFNCLHYADYENDPKLVESLIAAIKHGGKGIDAIQLDMIWPDPMQVWWAVQKAKDDFCLAHLEVILQIGKNALEEVSNDPKKLVKKLEKYDGKINRVLLDKSMGRGLGMDAHALLPFARAVREAFPRLGLVAAGGLGPKTMHLIDPLLQEFPDISWDAQGQLRPSASALDPVDWNFATQYLIESLKRC